LTRRPRRLEEGDRLALRALRIIEELRPRFWALENPATGLLKLRPFRGRAAVAGRQLLHLGLLLPQAHQDLGQLGLGAQATRLRRWQLSLRTIPNPGAAQRGLGSLNTCSLNVPRMSRGFTQE